MPDGIPDEIQPDLPSSQRDAFLFYPGTAKTMYANRVSFVFDFKGPSMVIDTACSSSLVAMDVAITDLRLGNNTKKMTKIFLKIAAIYKLLNFFLSKASVNRQ
jgi:hypothetical protein